MTLPPELRRIADVVERARTVAELDAALAQLRAYAAADPRRTVDADIGEQLLLMRQALEARDRARGP